jgi:hypothetical protein
MGTEWSGLHHFRFSSTYLTYLSVRPSVGAGDGTTGIVHATQELYYWRPDPSIHIWKLERKLVKWAFKQTYFFLFWWNWGLNSGLHGCKQVCYHLSHTSSPFSSGYFGDGVSRTICPGRPQTMILLISASQGAGITSVSYWSLTNGPSLSLY